MFKKICTCLLAISIFAMMFSTYLIAKNLQKSLQNEIVTEQERIVRLKQAVRVHDYILQINHPHQKSKLVLLDDINALVLEENRVINRADHRSFLEEIQNNLNQRTIPSEKVLNSWLASSLLNDLIELEKDFQPSQVNVAPLLLLTHEKWSSIFTVLIISLLMAAFCAGSLMNDYFTKRKLLKL